MERRREKGLDSMGFLFRVACIVVTAVLAVVVKVLGSMLCCC